jgi:hypothetical protein
VLRRLFHGANAAKVGSDEAGREAKGVAVKPDAETSAKVEAMA